MTDRFEPDWSTAPEWASWHAVDADMQGYWYAACPVCVNKFGWHEPYRELCQRNHDWHYDTKTMRDLDHRNSLRHRPEPPAQ